MFWYICNLDLGVALYWPLKESVSAGSGDGSVSLGAEFLAIWGEYGGSERQHSSILDVGTPGGSNDVCTVGIKGGSNGACTVGIKELEVVSGMNSESSGLVASTLGLMRALLKAWLVCLSCVYGLAECWRCWSWKTCSLGSCSIALDIENGGECYYKHYHTWLNLVFIVWSLLGLCTCQLSRCLYR